MFDTIDEGSTVKSLNRIKKAIAESLGTKYGIDDSETIDHILSIHGLNKKQNFDFISNVEKLIIQRINDISIDDNSNKNEKTMEGLFTEALSSVKKAVGFDYLYRSMKEEYGKQEAMRLLGEMMDLSLGISDSTKLMIPYCYALDASKIVTIGRPFGQLQSKPAKRVSSYISALCETVHQISHHIAGAVAIGTLFLDVAHLLLYNDKLSIEDLKCNTTRKIIENEFQQFVHSVNHLSRNANESPFTNISIFDRPKLTALLSSENFGWYFPAEGDYDSETWKEYVIDFIMELQDIFLDFFDKGDPMQDGMPYRFPVITINLSKDNGIILDEEFLTSICKRDIYRYNIFTSAGSKVASCCRLLSDTELLDLASQSNSFGGASISLGSHRVCTINFNRIALECTDEDDFYRIMSERIDSTAKILKSHKNLIKVLTDKGLQPFISNGWISMPRLFSTFGMLGIYEARETLRKKGINGNRDIIKEILEFFNAKVNEYSTKYGIVGNIEQIPGESFAVRLAKLDKMLFGEDRCNYQLYSNQFIPLWADSSIWEKMDEDGKYNQLVTGGGIVHIQIGEKVTASQAEKIIRYSVQSGCEHFALNAIYSACENDHTVFGSHDKCPKCGAGIANRYTRIVGFFTPVDSWNEVRREWEFPRRTFADVSTPKELTIA